MKNALATILLLASLTGAASVAADGVWVQNGDRDGYRVAGSGDPLSDSGATVSVRSTGTSPGPFGGGSTELDATSYRGHTVLLSAQLGTRDAIKGGSIWLRADGPSGRMAFATSQGQPVAGTSAPTHRQIHIDVPAGATRLVFGALLAGPGEVSATGLRLRRDAPSAAAEAVSATQLLDATIAIVRGNALRARNVDWPRVEARIRAMPGDASAPEAAYPAIRALLAELGDNHSALLTPARRHHMDGVAKAASTPRVERLPQGVGYVAMPAFLGTEPQASAAFADGVVDAIDGIAGGTTCGWIVDLRHNGGGNMWPMLAALRPMLGSGELGSLEGPDGNRFHPWHANARITARPGPDLAHAPVAVLTGPRTASSGEAVAIAFRGRPNTRSFGRPTAGLSTSNRTFDLADGSRLMLTTAVFVDRGGHAYGGKLPPDQLVDEAPAQTPPELAVDPVVAAARAWLKVSGGCDEPAQDTLSRDAAASGQ